ncbi:hypothetical protein HZ326_2463 [Fusarium oxysporum f. sp. albedinis]|nr:hypothetical protein HZ326_2463 [Fusarium oxysporum f. sp. albedinis]
MFSMALSRQANSSIIARPSYHHSFGSEIRGSSTPLPNKTLFNKRSRELVSIFLVPPAPPPPLNAQNIWTLWNILAAELKTLYLGTSSKLCGNFCISRLPLIEAFTK